MKVCPKCLKKLEDTLDRCPDDNRALLPLEGKDPALGEALSGRFLLTGLLGRGAMGVVYKGYQLSMRRFVAVKVLLPHIASSDQHVQRFIREATSAAQLKNPHTVTLYDFGETDDGRLFIAMELLSGKELADVLVEKVRFTVAEALDIVSQACLSLEEAHERGIVHRDLKPANIMVEERPDNPYFVKIVDFGIAKLLDEGATMVTQDGSTCGTPSYMAPEQVMGKHLDARTDIYALGVVLFELLTGKRPFMDTAATAILLRHLQEPIPSLLEVFPDLNIPPEADAIVQKCVAKVQSERYSSCLELRKACMAAQGASGGAVATEAYREVDPVEGTVQTFPMGEDETAVQDVVQPPSQSTRGFEETATQDAATVVAVPESQVPTAIAEPPELATEALIRKSGSPGWLWPTVGGIVVLLLIAAGLFVMSTNKQEGVAGESGGAAQATSSSGVAEAEEGATSEVTERAARPAAAGPDMVAPPDAVSSPTADMVAPPEIVAPVADMVAPPEVVADVTGPAEVGADGGAMAAPDGGPSADVAVQQPAQMGDVHVVAAPEVVEQGAAPMVKEGGSQVAQVVEKKVEKVEKIEKKVEEKVEKKVEKKAASASVSGIQVTGSVDKSAAKQVVRRAGQRLSKCLDNHDWPDGGIKVTVMFGPDGKATSVKVAPGGDAGDCVKKRLKSVSYPTFTGSFSILRFKVARK
jgi:eukaryotic-like serine/threonine-protein kinase